MAAACQRLYENIVKKRMYITGGIGSSGTLERFTADYDLPNDRMYCESCASVGLMMFAQRMASLTGEAVYYDVVERALCNTVLGLSLIHISPDHTKAPYFWLPAQAQRTRFTIFVWPAAFMPS